MTAALLQNSSIGCKMGGNFESGGVAKRPKATVCKTVIRRFESGRRLFLTTPLIYPQDIYNDASPHPAYHDCGRRDAA